ncbi:hypothetical protein SprV_0100347700 [Sparganum proliferum]
MHCALSVWSLTYWTHSNSVRHPQAMALSFDDRLLGEKVDNYCSSSDEQDDSEDGESFNNERVPSDRPNASCAPPRPTFNRIFDLNASTFVTEIDNEAPSVTVIILIYEEV